MTATELVDHLQRGEITAVQALLYYSAMAVEAHKRYNCLTQVMFASALARAEELDAKFKASGPVGPLHGLPVSIKECIAIKGTYSTGGLVHFLNVAEEDAVIVKLLKSAGAVLYVKTNVPQTMLIADCGNHIYGTTKNPFDESRTPGGSSGGEACLVAAGGSPFGIGTDIGGSIRMPAAWCGLLGMMPTEGRFTTVGNSPPIFPGLIAINSTCGPMVRHPSDAVLFYRAISGKLMNKLDPLTPNVSFDETQYSGISNDTSTEKSDLQGDQKSSSEGERKTSLVIGYFVDNGVFTPSRACQRAVNIAVEELRRKGHTVVPFQPHNVLEAHECFFTFMAGDGAWNLKNIFSKERVHPCISRMWGLLTAPWLVRVAVHSLLKTLGWARIAAAIRIWAGSAKYEHQIIQWKNNYRREMIERMKAAGIDAIVCPGPAVPPPHHNETQLMAAALGYTYFWNVIRFPGAAFPVATVTDEDVIPPRKVSDVTDLAVKKAEEGSQGLPVPIQVVSYPFGDETILRIAGELEHLMPDLTTQLATAIAANIH